jgi:hypothetical protein
MIRHRTGYSRVDVLAIVVLLAILGCVASVLFGQQKHSGAEGNVQLHPKSVKDAEQMRGIHQAWLVFSNEYQGIMPTPGLVRRLPVDGQIQPGRGAEDKNANTTANLYSFCIMGNYFGPELSISPVERNPKVKVQPDDVYNFQAYNVVNAVYWDANFAADLEKGSNVSYAHQPIAGEWAKKWRATSDAKWPVLGNRGPKGGGLDPSSFTCGPHGNWAGNIIYMDNHVEYFHNAVPGTDDADPSDNIFAPHTKGALITFTKEFVNGEPVFQFD